MLDFITSISIMVRIHSENINECPPPVCAHTHTLGHARTRAPISNQIIIAFGFADDAYYMEMQNQCG